MIIEMGPLNNEQLYRVELILDSIDERTASSAPHAVLYAVSRRG